MNWGLLWFEAGGLVTPIARHPLRSATIAPASYCAWVRASYLSTAVLIACAAVLRWADKCPGPKMLIVSDPACSAADAWR
jgi:hypothetical protein